MIDEQVHIGYVCEKGNHFAPNVEGGGCGSHYYADVYVGVKQHREGRHGVLPDVSEIVEEIELALVYFAEHGRPGMEFK